MEKLKELYTRYRSLIDPLLFILITYGAHKLYWANIGWVAEFEWMAAARKFMRELLFDHSWYIVKNYLYEVTHEGTTLLFPNNGYIAINNSCTGIKQFYQIFVLFLLFPGPWKKKLWYIPMSIILMHGVNIFRIVALSIILMNWPQHWDFMHDWVLRPFFYIVIFGLWWFWNERIRR